METQFLEISEVILIHENQIDLYGGSRGIRDYRLLESAINMPRVMFDGNYLHKSIFDKAAAYVYHITNNHPFVDGNKRTALAVCLVFLDWNNIDIEDPNEELYDMMILTSSGKLNKDDISILLKKLS